MTALESIRAALSTQRETVSQLQHSLLDTQRKLGSVQDDLRRKLAALYSVGRQGYLKLALSQNRIGDVTRVLAYQQYLREWGNQTLSDFAALVQTREKVDAELARAIHELRELGQQQASLERLAQGQQEQRLDLLARLGADIDASTERLETLRRDDGRLAKLLDELDGEALASIAEDPDQTPFADRQGQLPWPLSGRLTKRFGAPRQTDNRTWQGVTIAATDNTQVRAIAHGRVAFSEWLRGFGMLIILDHGDGFMSLYGNNRELLKEVGDWVTTGEPIAVVDKTPQEELGLYFEIRHNGEPQNPVSWCQAVEDGITPLLVSG